MHRKLPAVLTHSSRSPVHLSALFLLHSSTSISHVTPSQPALQLHFPLTGSHDLVLCSTQLHLSVHSQPKKKFEHSAKERTNTTCYKRPHLPPHPPSNETVCVTTKDHADVCLKRRTTQSAHQTKLQEKRKRTPEIHSPFKGA